ncbi:hypothetical protein HNV12_02330 [Methanococcoides sp. SA1]|nr:hypothetical protein [Methanococcoides sp. SA1]
MSERSSGGGELVEGVPFSLFQLYFETKQRSSPDGVLSEIRDSGYKASYYGPSKDTDCITIASNEAINKSFADYLRIKWKIDRVSFPAREKAHWEKEPWVELKSFYKIDLHTEASCDSEEKIFMHLKSKGYDSRCRVAKNRKSITLSTDKKILPSDLDHIRKFFRVKDIWGSFVD